MFSLCCLSRGLWSSTFSIRTIRLFNVAPALGWMLGRRMEWRGVHTEIEYLDLFTGSLLELVEKGDGEVEEQTQERLYIFYSTCSASLYCVSIFSCLRLWVSVLATVGASQNEAWNGSNRTIRDEAHCRELTSCYKKRKWHQYSFASLAQSVERKTLNLKVAGSTPAWGFLLLLFCSC